MLREAPEVALVTAWMTASREDKRALLMVLEASRESERVAENLWSVSPAELSWTDAPKREAH